MKPFTSAFNDVAGPDRAALRVTLLTALYFILLIDADEQRDAEHRRVLDCQKAHQREQQERRTRGPRPAQP